ncbi:type IX secretion system sortase PorU [Fulvivirga sediminis]|uniref:Type IX secretion system sortase PorU n=1 Tax=Fulvivirga sediminis TaxID=2803949 RepID=A0A937FA53_9BACT|nr:type IX secretion system sortase PorU [Fulvivirga sediminis]MBL3657094.1 type IX secretion system sortase PorU [Fulvivirga sediminis]
MSKAIKVLSFTLLALAVSTNYHLYGQKINSVLRSGDWYKLEIDHNGVYKIDYNFLKSIGISIDRIDPKKIAIYGNGGGTLPQKNSAPRPADLINNHIYVKGEDDGKFNSDDYILFYAQGPDKYNYSTDGEITYERNIYSNHNYYYLSIGAENGKRVKSSDDLGQNHNRITTFTDFAYYKKEEENLLLSGRDWYSRISNEQIILEIPNITANTNIQVTSTVMAQSFSQSSFTLSLNGSQIGTQIVNSVPNFMTPSQNNPHRYSVKGLENTSTFSSKTASTVNSLNLGISYTGNNSGRSLGFLKEIIVEFTRSMSLDDNQLAFRSFANTSTTLSTYFINNCKNSCLVFDVTIPTGPTLQRTVYENGTISFGSNSTNNKEFVVFDPNQLPSPKFLSRIENQNIHNINVPELLIITHKNFQSQALQLANHHERADGISTTVVTTEQVYNEFSSGKQDITAMRDFIKYLYDQSHSLKYVLLFGKATFDYKDIKANNTNFVPTYESRNSLHPLQTYCSDDYFGFMEDEEGEWAEIAGGNHSLEIGVGRIPAATTQEAQNVVDKIINYSSPQTYGAWRNTVAFVADDGDNNLHIDQSNQLSELMDTTYSAFNYNKLFLDAYKQDASAPSIKSPEMVEAINASIKKGTLIMNYTGHGGKNVWAQETILNIPQIENWDNKNRLPLFVTATCEFGRHDDISAIRSGGEVIINSAEKGGIAIISTCRPVYASSNFQLNQAFYNTVFSKPHGQYLRLGDIIRITKNNSANNAVDQNQVGNRNFILLGDPALRLNYPEKNIIIESISGTQSTDTLSALDQISLTGKVLQSAGNTDSQFSGDLEITVFDKEATLTTLGDEDNGLTYSYKSRENTLFRGDVSINSGVFDAEFIVPKNISYQLEKGKISMYAVNAQKNSDANGADINVIVGGSTDSYPHDNTGPEIDIFFGDSTYSSKIPVNTNTLLVANLKDEHGINISNYNVNNSLTVQLDDQKSVVVNDYYKAKKNTYKEGWLRYPLNNLSEGLHTLTIKAWDTHNNSSEKTVEFLVGAEGSLAISQLKNSPNPFVSKTVISFKHNRAGDNLQVELEIINISGEKLLKRSFEFENAPGEINLFEWDGKNSIGKKTEAGLYIYKVSVRSNVDGAKNHTFQKLILIN